MSLTGAVTNSVDALKAQTTALSTISQNIANVSTTGYKTAETDFATILSQNSSDTSAYGVKASTRNLARLQGNITSTGNDMDLAISGKGFFVVNSAADGSGTTYFTRNGSLTVTPGTEVSSTASSGLAYLTDANGDFLMGWAGATAPTTTSSSTSGLTALSYDTKSTMAAKATTAVTLKGTVPATSTGTTTAAIAAYDSTGTSQNIELTLTPATDSSGNVIAGQWNATFTPPSGSATTTTLTFDSSGNLTSPTSAVSVTTSWGSVAVDMSSVVENATSSTASLTEKTNDGYAEGKFKSVSIDDTGAVNINYDNNQSTQIGTVALAQFIEPNNLEPTSGTLFKQTTSAGTLELGTTSSLSGQSSLVTSSLESSTVDIETQFSNMVEVQQAYQSASKLWGTVDQMYTTLRDLVQAT